MKAGIRSTVAAAMLALPAAASFMALPASAAAAPAAAPQIRSLQVNSDEGLSRGADLTFALQATPGARASVNFSGISVPLSEASPGNYRGTYTVRGRDRIDPTQAITAQLAANSRTATHNFTWPTSFQQLAMGNAPAVAVARAAEPAPAAGPAEVHIEGLRARPRDRLEPGRDFHVTFRSVPGGEASFDIPGVVAGVPMHETAPGRYEGSYTVRMRDDPSAFGTTVATLRSGRRTVTARLTYGPREDVAIRRDRDRDRVRDGGSPPIVVYER